jgi:hypothetical protein
VPTQTTPAAATYSDAIVATVPFDSKSRSRANPALDQPVVNEH